MKVFNLYNQISKKYKEFIRVFNYFPSIMKSI